MSIPIRNIYYLLCYAWEKPLKGRDRIATSPISGNRVENLLGTVLDSWVTDLTRRGLDRGYVDVEEEGRKFRGKLLVKESLSRILLPQGRVACRIDELSYDVPHNRVVKAALHSLINLPSLDGTLRGRLRAHWVKFAGVSDERLSPKLFRQVQLHQNVAHYAFLINVARLIERSMFPDQRTGQLRFHPFTESSQILGHLFESFVRNFLRREQADFKVASKKVPWDIDLSSSSDPSWLPEMRTDIVLQCPSRRIVIETKCEGNPLSDRRFSGTSEVERKKLKNSHLYQLMSYLMHLSADEGARPEGLLLYADVDQIPNLTYRLGGFTLMVRSLNLNQEWPNIHRNILELVSELSGGQEAQISA